MACKIHYHQPLHLVSWNLHSVVTKPDFHKAASFQAFSLSQVNRGMPHFVQQLQKTRKLETLGLRGVQFTRPQWKQLGGALALNRSLTSLDLSMNGLTDKDLAVIAKKLPSKLKAINLSSNQITPKGMKHLLKAMQTLPRVTCVSLSDNPLGDEEAALLGGKTSLLFLERTHLTSLGVKRMAPNLLRNRHLRVLSLRGNRVDEQALPELVDLVSRHGRLQELDLGENAFKNPSQTHFQLTLKKINPSLEIVL